MISTGYTKKMIHFSKRCEEEKECISRRIIFLSYTSSSLIISSFLPSFLPSYSSSSSSSLNDEGKEEKVLSTFLVHQLFFLIFSLSLFSLSVLFYSVLSSLSLSLSVLSCSILLLFFPLYPHNRDTHRSTQNKVFTITNLSILLQLTIISFSDDIKILTVGWMDEKLISSSKMYYLVYI